MKIVFLGTPEIAISSLEYFINKDDIEVCAVVTQPDRPSGRGHKLVAPPVKVLALDNNIKVFQPKKIRADNEVIEALKAIKPDAFITVAFGQILSQEVLDIPRLGTINLHASLLPKYRGANPLQWAILNGDKTTGVTTMLSELGVDTGPMILKEEITITENMTTIDLASQVSKVGPEILYKSITGLDNKSIIPKPQDEAQATHAPKLKKEDGLIDWCKTGNVIHNQVRGMKPWPATYTFYKSTPLKITETRLIKNKEIVDKYKPGQIIDIIKGGLEVATGKGTILVTKVQPQGKKEIDAKSWCNGARVQVGDCFSTEQIKKE